ncbi:MAG: 2-hydroxyacyl-CoA dehydratase [Deltaproteobacteria bacterium]|nr:2-hydroxyacyl-CoA dehydratase [Deltaproteobacteria bacterium]
MSTLERLQSIAQNPARVAERWKADGGKVLGYRCLYLPEEIIWAAGMLPYPLYGTPEPVGLADAYFQSCTCEFIRNLFDHALSDRLAFLDGLALSNTCDVVRRLYDMWSRHVPATPVYLVNNPQKLLGEANRDYFMEELRRFRARMEEIAGREITDDGLRDAIALHNRTRALLRELYALREQDPPPLTGAEALEICMAVTVLPADHADGLLTELLAELRGRQVEPSDGPRILVTGSMLDHPALIRMVEEEGGVVVIDDLCNTSRTFWHRVEDDPDPLTALYRFLNSRALCACMHPVEARIEHVLELVDTYRVDAAIDFNLKYCHPFLYEAPLLKERLEAEDIPVTVLEVGHDLSGHGQLRTRIQAFIEMVSV